MLFGGSDIVGGPGTAGDSVVVDCPGIVGSLVIADGLRAFQCSKYW